MSTLPPAPQTDSATPPPQGPFAALRRMLPAAEVIRYLLVGVSNTVFGYLLYSGFVFLYGHFLPRHYVTLTVILAAVSAKPIGITMAFFCYKHFVFRTQDRKSVV